LQLPTRLIEQAGDVARAEQVEFRAGSQQSQEIIGRQLVAEGIFNGRVQIGRRPASRHGADRKALPGTEAEDGIFGDGHFTGLARLHLARFDEVEESDLAGIRPDDLAAGSIKNDLRLFGKTLQGVRLHFVERGMVAQKRLRIAGHSAAPTLTQRHFNLADGLFLYLLFFLPCLLLRSHDNLIF